MECCFSAGNTIGFSSQLESGVIPEADHITYGGAFNELQFEIGPKAQKNLDLHIGFARANNPSSFKDKKVNQFLALFLKGNKDGQPRDNRVLNAVIILDISGSMGGQLCVGSSMPRLQLAKQAIKMFVSKLRPNDSFGLVTFNDQGHVIIKGSKKSELDLESVFAVVDSIKTNGGTTLQSGFITGLSVLKSILSNSSKSKQNFQNRLVMLTDVGDNSIPTTNDFISKVSQQNIHTTIVGISEQFRSDICQSLTKIKGFNYFCAVKTDDLKRYLFENFDWTFFPSSFNIQIKLISENVKMFEVFGTPDEKDVNGYNDFTKKGQNQYVITKITSSFPSELVVDKGVVKTYGGLVLLKLSPQAELTEFKGKIQLSYTTIQGQSVTQIYPIHFSFPPNQQFYSEKCLEQAISGFYFVYEMKQLINEFNGESGTEQRKQRNQKYVRSFEELKNIAPESKIKDIDGIIKILKQYE